MKARDIAKQYGFDKSFRKPFYAMLMLLFVISCFSLLFVGCSNTGNINYEESSIDNLKFRNISFGTEEKKTLATIKKDLAQQEYYEEPRIRDNSYLSNEHTATYYNINLSRYLMIDIIILVISMIVGILKNCVFSSEATEVSYVLMIYFIVLFGSVLILSIISGIVFLLLYLLSKSVREFIKKLRATKSRWLKEKIFMIISSVYLLSVFVSFFALLTFDF